MMVAKEKTQQKYKPQLLSSSKFPISSTQSTQWANQVSHLQNELLSSWMTRVAHANFTSITSLIWLWGFRPFTEDFDTKWNPIIMDHFLQNTDQSEVNLRNFMLFPLQSSIETCYKNSAASPGRILDILFTDWEPRSRNGIRFCPICLKSDKIPYFRKEWRYGFLPICPIHNCFLEQHCEKCGSQIAYCKLDDDHELKYCYHCNTDLSLIIPKSLPENDSLLNYFHDAKKKGFEKEIYQILEVAWFLSSYCGLKDSIFQNHPFTSDAEIESEWITYFRKANRIPLFHNLKYLYLIIGTSIRILHDNDIASLHSFHVNIISLMTKTPFYCDQCDYTSSSYPRILFHSFHTKEIYACSECKMTFDSYDKWIKHQKESNLHHQACWICHKSFENAEDLKNHMIYHSISRLIVCETCGKIQCDQASLVIHKMIHTQERPFKCDSCGWAFRTKAMLNDHHRIHTNERPYECSFCKKKFRTSTRLNEHKRTHTGERPYKCKICGKSFNTATGFNQHSKIHTGEKIVTCKECGEKLSSPKSLKRHMLIHSNSWGVQCDLCEKQFRTKSALIRHNKVHEQIKDLICEICNKQFNRKDHLKRHMKCH